MLATALLLWQVVRTGNPTRERELPFTDFMNQVDRSRGARNAYRSRPWSNVAGYAEVPSASFCTGCASGAGNILRLCNFQVSSRFPGLGRKLCHVFVHADRVSETFRNFP
jgi:hypothetical protein